MRRFLRLVPARELLAFQPIRWLIISRFCSNIFFSSTTIVLFQQQRGLNFTEMFLMEAILSGGIWLADVPTSVWADRFGYRRMLILGCLFNLVGGCFFLFAYGFWLFAIANVLSGFAIACASGCEDALLYNNLTQEVRAQQGNAAFTLLRLAASGGFFLGLATGSFIGAYSPTLAVAASIVPSGCALFAAWHIRKPEVTGKEARVGEVRAGFLKVIKVALQTMRHQPILSGLQIFGSMAFSLTNAIFWFNQPYFGRAGIPIFWFGPAMALAMAGQMLAIARVPWLLKHLRTRAMLILSCLLPGIAYLLLTTTTQALFTIALVACVVVFPAWQGPLIDNELNQRIEDAARATTLSALTLVGSLASIAVKLWMGTLGDRGLTVTGIGMGTSLLLLCVLVPFIVRKPEAQKAEVTTR
jgi:MFS family permease